MMATTTWLDLCDEIDDGKWDEGLDEIAKAIGSRRDIVSRRNARRLMRSLSVGDRVKLTNGIKPRYLEGMVGQVMEVRSESAIVMLDRMPTHTGAGRPPAEGFKQKLNVPLENLKVLKEGDATELSEVDLADKIGDDSDDMEEIDDDD